MSLNFVALKLAFKSLKNRKFTSILTVISISLSICLFLGVERVRNGARESFSNTISQTDLIVGARTGTTQLLLNTVFHLGNGLANISMESYEKYKNHPAVLWTIPFSMGDSHHGFRVIGTDINFYKFYRYHTDRQIQFKSGEPTKGLFDVVLGADVATSLKYELGQKIAITHGITDGMALEHHDDKPLQVVGILNKTGTPIDRSLFVTLEGLEAVHSDWKDGAPPLKGHETHADDMHIENIHVDEISSFLIRTKSRINTLPLQREINTLKTEPLMAIIPGVALNELWSTISYAENAMRIVSFFIVIIGFMGMLISIYTSLNERRREMSIIRSIGGGPLIVIKLLVTEAILLGVGGIVCGVALMFSLLYVFNPLIEREFGLVIGLANISNTEFIYLAIVFGASFISGIIPALKAYSNSLQDGLTVKN